MKNFFGAILLAVLVLVGVSEKKVLAGVIFEDNFNSQADWNTDKSKNGECNYPCATAPTNWNATRSEPGNASFVHPPGSISALPGGLPDHSGNVNGKAYIIWQESNNTINWPGDSILAKIFLSNYPEIYYRIFIRSQSNWQYVNPMQIKNSYVLQYDMTGDYFTYFGAGFSGPIYEHDMYWNGPYGNRTNESYRCFPQSSDYYCQNSPSGQGGSGANTQLWPGSAYTDLPTSPGEFADTNWHQLDVHLKLNTKTGSTWNSDGVLEWWWDVPTTSTATPLVTDTTTWPPTVTKTYPNHGAYFARSDIQWISNDPPSSAGEIAAAKTPGFNSFGIGGNANNSFSGASNGEQWYAIDDVVVSTTPIPANYVIGGGAPAGPPAPTNVKGTGTM